MLLRETVYYRHYNSPAKSAILLFYIPHNDYQYKRCNSPLPPPRCTSIITSKRYACGDVSVAAAPQVQESAMLLLIVGNVWRLAELQCYNADTTTR